MYMDSVHMYSSNIKHKIGFNLETKIQCFYLI